MNLLLLDAAELDAHGQAWIGGRRARHLRDILGVAPGRTVRAGVVDGGQGVAEVLAVEAERVAVRCTFDPAAAAPRPADTLLLAVPRPKVLGRCLEAAAALGFGRVLLLRTWRVDKAHLHSRALSAPRLRHHLLLGLEQSARTALPVVGIEPLFKPFVEDRLDDLLGAANRVLGHPAAATDVAATPLAADRPLAVAIGPERGLTDYEVEQLAAHGFVSVRGAGGAHPLRVETALVALSAQLQLRRTLANAGLL